MAFLLGFGVRTFRIGKKGLTMHRPITPEDREIIDRINLHIFEAWKLWRTHFMRTPEEAAKLMINAIKDHERIDDGEIADPSQSEAGDPTKH